MKVDRYRIGIVHSQAWHVPAGSTACVESTDEYWAKASELASDAMGQAVRFEHLELVLERENPDGSSYVRSRRKLVAA